MILAREGAVHCGLDWGGGFIVEIEESGDPGPFSPA